MSDSGDAAARVGAVVGGKYSLTSLLGVGGMGAVYAAENTWTRRPVALKLLHPEFARTPGVAERFMQEAQLASQLRHPNIVDVLDLGQDPGDGSLYIVQELLQGNDLRTVIDASGRVDVQTALDVALPLMGALALAHRRGVVHRDIKPENIFLAGDEHGESTPKLIDFGISKVTAQGRDDRNLTQAGTLVGTPNYMSPEQARGDADLDGQTDVWSLGVVLYEMLSGKLPFDAPNQNVLMVKIIMEPAPRIESVAPDLPAGRAAVVHTALANDRGARYPDMQSFAAALIGCSDAAPTLFERHRRSLPPEIGALLHAAPRATPRTLPPPTAPIAVAEAGRLERATFGQTIVDRPTTQGTPVGWSQEAASDPVASSSGSRRAVVIAGLVSLALVVSAASVWLVQRPSVSPSHAATPSVRPPPPRIVAPVALPPPQAPSPAVTPPEAEVAPLVETAPTSAPPRLVRRVTPPPSRRVPPRGAPPVATHNGAPILSP
jgi:serine/threonine protein kinase